MPGKIFKTMSVFLLASLVLLASWVSIVQGKEISKIRVGVLANKGKPAAVKTWQPLIDYLALAIPEQGFALVPLDFDELYPQVEAGNVDFIITNTGQYIELELDYGVSRLATFQNCGPGGLYTKFGGVLFVRADCKDIHTIGDFPGHKILVADEKSFGGWLMQLREIKNQGVEPGQFTKFDIAGNHEKVVFSVLKGDFDIGAIRTDTLERMADEGKIDLGSIRIINEQHEPGFPFRHSTRLYPEWPFAKAAHTDSTLASKVAVALLTLPENSPAAKAAQSGGWTIPEDYSQVHELYRELKLGPYQQLGKFNAVDVIKKYWQAILLSVLLLVVTGIATVWISVINRRLGTTLTDLNISHEKLERTNAQLVESMQYARIIQESLLPDHGELEGIVADLAVLWKPLDLVGGDYYRLGKINGKACLMLADCTGHGVPGALVTMILSSSLDSILHEKKLTDPGQILKEIDWTVRRRLRQDMPGTTTDDGLEAAVCVYNPCTKVLEFAGAGLPLLCVKGEKANLIKGDRYSLGYRTLQPKSAFKVHKLTVEPDLAFYMFTDGITNLMGGRQRQLFGWRRLANLITGLDRQPLTEQMQAVKENLQFYGKDEKPRDDMTIVCFRFK